ncbi:transposase [Micromonospora fulviviridis]|uniref:Transposase n=1 Tax=Micromonospora fulviviridis TaxID=47860 RepID=A0ABV2VTU8_9ACTN
MSQVRRFVAVGLDEAAGRRRRRGLVIAALDETGQPKQGQATCGVKRQYMGCAGRAANGINTVHLSYVREKTGLDVDTHTDNLLLRPCAASANAAWPCSPSVGAPCNTPPPAPDTDR